MYVSSDFCSLAHVSMLTSSHGHQSHTGDTKYIPLFHGTFLPNECPRLCGHTLGQVCLIVINVDMLQCYINGKISELPCLPEGSNIGETTSS